jgi:hypothetical protein
MLIRLDINQSRLDTIVVTNRGPLDGAYAPGDAPGGDGWRLYEFSTPAGSGFVEHRRDDGAHVLAAKVLAAVSNVKSYPNTATTERNPT